MIPGLDFVAIDVETASRKRGSICQIGLARVRDGIVVDKRARLMKPPATIGNGAFEPVCVDIHGITPYMVADEPGFGRLFRPLVRYLGDDLLVAHNAAFDRSNIAAACRAEGLATPENQWLCTVEESRHVLPDLVNHKLPTVAAALGVKQVHHHEAGDDAAVAARIYIELVRLSTPMALSD